MSNSVYLAAVDFTRARLMGSLEAIEKSGQDVAGVLAWRPGPGRAHIAWQAMHCAATHDKYVNMVLRGGQAKDPTLVQNYGGGSTPSDTNLPTLATIRQALETHLVGFKDFIAGMAPGDADRIVVAGNKQRTVSESIILLTWHEAHHQGQIHLTWNLYRAAHGLA